MSYFMNVTSPPNTYKKWTEWMVGILLLGYFLLYNRDTLSDFIVCSSLCLLLALFRQPLGLTPPKVRPWGKADTILSISMVSLFATAWIYGYSTGKITPKTASISLAISLVYVYYAFIQHFLAQAYLAVRLWQWSEQLLQGKPSRWSPELMGALTTGIVFGILHIPYPHLIIAATIGGCLFAYYYLITGRLWMVILGHALISSPSLYWYLDDNPFLELVALFE